MIPFKNSIEFLLLLFLIAEYNKFWKRTILKRKKDKYIFSLVTTNKKFDDDKLKYYHWFSQIGKYTLVNV